MQSYRVWKHLVNKGAAGICFSFTQTKLSKIQFSTNQTFCLFMLPFSLYPSLNHYIFTRTYAGLNILY